MVPIYRWGDEQDSHYLRKLNLTELENEAALTADSI